MPGGEGSQRTIWLNRNWHKCCIVLAAPGRVKAQGPPISGAAVPTRGGKTDEVGVEVEGGKEGKADCLVGHDPQVGLLPVCARVRSCCKTGQRAT